MLHQYVVEVGAAVLWCIFGTCFSCCISTIVLCWQPWRYTATRKNNSQQEN